MGKATRTFSGASQKKYFRDLFRAAGGVTPEAAEALAGTCEREIAQLRVRLPIPDRGGAGKAAKTTKDRREPAAAPGTATAEAVAPADVAADSAAPADITPPDAASEAPAAFDPFSFSLVVALTKEGREGLAQRLAQIGSAGDLRALARAQHVALPEGDLTLADLRAAIVDGAEQRIANRRAAAS